MKDISIILLKYKWNKSFTKKKKDIRVYITLNRLWANAILLKIWKKRCVYFKIEMV